ncbi:transcription factor of the MADS box [Microbotryomycetes sp. JL221]|nr:transcription factor of the MADS box [Microbotryomycetes sp. JL221]
MQSSSNESSSQLNIIVAPETNKFNSPLPAQGSDKRKPFDTSKPTRFMDMTSKKGGVKRTADHFDQDNQQGSIEPDDDEGEEEEQDEEEEEETTTTTTKKKYSNKRNATSTGRRKIAISYIDDKAKRHVSFTKRKAGLMKKAFELSTLTGTNCLVLVVSETGLVYTYATPGLRPIIAHEDGKDVISRTLKGELQVEGSFNVPPTQSAKDNSSGSTTPEPRQTPTVTSRPTVQKQNSENQQHQSQRRKSSTLPASHQLDPTSTSSMNVDNTLPIVSVAPPVSHHSANLFESGPIDYLHGNLDALFGTAVSSSSSSNPISTGQTRTLTSTTPGTSSAGSLMPTSLPSLYTTLSTSPTSGHLNSLPNVNSTTTTSSTSTYPLMSSLSNQQTSSLNSFSSPSTTGPRTAWERAAAEHAVAFQSYQARTQNQVLPSSSSTTTSSSSINLNSRINSPGSIVTSIDSQSNPLVNPTLQRRESIQSNPLVTMSTHGAHEFSEEARKWQPPERSRLMIPNPHLLFNKTNQQQQQQEGKVSNSSSYSLEERRNQLKQESNYFLKLAFEKKTISNFIKAHKMNYRSNLTVPPTSSTIRSSSSSSSTTSLGSFRQNQLEQEGQQEQQEPLSGIETTMEHFKTLCESGGIELPDLLGPALETFLGDYLPNVQRYNVKMLNEARTHLMLFLDFLEAHELISTFKHEKLLTFFPTNYNIHSNYSSQQSQSQLQQQNHDKNSSNHHYGNDNNGAGSIGSILSSTSPSTTTTTTHLLDSSTVGHRKHRLIELLNNWSKECQNQIETNSMTTHSNPNSSIEGWFELIKSNSKFGLFKSKLKLLNQQKEPKNDLLTKVFRVRLSQNLINELRMGDGVWLSLARVKSGDQELEEEDQQIQDSNNVWLPLQSGPVDVAPGPPMPDADPNLDMAIVNAQRSIDVLSRTDQNPMSSSSVHDHDDVGHVGKNDESLKVAKDHLTVLMEAQRLLRLNDVSES